MAPKTGYEPLFTLKPVAPEIWVVDGGSIRFYGMPFPTRMTVIRLASGELFIHSPVALAGDLRAEVSALGPVRYLVAPNWIHYAWVRDWQQAFPESLSWASPGVRARALGRGVDIAFDAELGDEAPPEWAGQIDQVVADSGWHREVVFFHRASRTLVLTDLIENLEPQHLPWWFRLLARAGGVLAPEGGMPRDMALSFRRRRAHLRDVVERMLSWKPERVIIAHGRCFEHDGEAVLRRAFAKVLRG